MVSKKKKMQVKELCAEINQYPVIGMLDMFKLPAKQLQEIRQKLKGKARIKMVKKSVIKRAMENVDKPGMKELEMKIQKQPAILFSKTNPFELARVIESSKSFAAAREGDVAPKDIELKAGKTSLKAGPVIGELQRVKIPAGVEGENIVIKEDSVVVKKGENIDKGVADVLMKLGVEPIEISLNMLAAWEEGLVYTKDILFVPLDKYENDLAIAYKNAFNLSLNIGLPTKENIPLLLSKAYREAVGLAKEAGLVTKETVGVMISKAYSEMLAIKDKIPAQQSTESAEREDKEKSSEPKEPKADEGKVDEDKGDKK